MHIDFSEIEMARRMSTRIRRALNHKRQNLSAGVHRRVNTVERLLEIIEELKP